MSGDNCFYKKPAEAAGDTSFNVFNRPNAQFVCTADAGLGSATAGGRDFVTDKHFEWSDTSIGQVPLYVSDSGQPQSRSLDYMGAIHSK